MYNNGSLVVLCYVGEQARQVNLFLIEWMHKEGFTAIMAPDRNLRRQLSWARRMGAGSVVVTGEAEIERGQLHIRDFQDGIDYYTQFPLEVAVRSVRAGLLPKSSL